MRPNPWSILFIVLSLCKFLISVKICWTELQVQKVAHCTPDRVMKSTGFIPNSLSRIQSSLLNMCATSVLCWGKERKSTVVALVPRHTELKNWLPLWLSVCTFIVARYSWMVIIFHRHN